MISTSDMKDLIVRALGEENANNLKTQPQRMSQILAFMFSMNQVDKIEEDGGMAVWGPSTAKEPSLTHQRYYGKNISDIKTHEVPGQRWGCQCSIVYMKKK